MLTPELLQDSEVSLRLTNRLLADLHVVRPALRVPGDAAAPSVAVAHDPLEIARLLRRELHALLVSYRRH